MAPRPRLAVAAAALLLAACASQPQVITRVQTQTVDVPVTVKATPPATATQCRSKIGPAPKFKGAPAVPGVAKGSLLLPADQVPVFLRFTAGAFRCISIWSAWAETPVAAK